MVLQEISGHAAHYRENMFQTDIEKQLFGLKPMNCPGEQEDKLTGYTVLKPAGPPIYWAHNLHHVAFESTIFSNHSTKKKVSCCLPFSADNKRINFPSFCLGREVP